MLVLQLWLGFRGACNAACESLNPPKLHEKHVGCGWVSSLSGSVLWVLQLGVGV